MIPDYLKPPEQFSGKKWGTIKQSRDKKSWVIEGHPYMITMAKRLFPGSWGKRDRGYIRFPISKRYVGDLNWFMMRFPLKIKNKEAWKELLNGAQEHFEKQEKIRKTKVKANPSPTFIGELKEFQKEGLAFLLHNPRSLLADEMGLGKAMPLDSFLLTPSGWIMMKYIKIGDYVIGRNGKPTKVIAVFPQGKRPVYKVTFIDGSSVECDEGHVWAVKTANHRFCNSNYRHLTLNQIMEKGIRYNNGNSIHFIPMVVPIEFKKRELPLNPYVLGCFIGDGCLCEGIPSISNSDKEIIEIITKNLPDGVKIFKSKTRKHDYKIQSTDKRGDKKNNLTEFFREFGLWEKKSDTKFIPEEYRFSTIDDRMQLLQGILDTDGSVTKSANVIEYASASKRLIIDVKFLVESFGGTARLKSRIPWYTYNGMKKKGKISYRLTISLPPQIKPFKLKRKADIYHPREKYQPYRAIKSIEYIGKKECQCIKVDAEDGLFVTNDCIVTHNTPTALAWLTSLKCGPPYILVVPPHIMRQWDSEIRKFLSPSIRTHLIHGLKPYSLPDVDIFIIHYLLLRGWKAELPEYGFSACVFDEIQELRRDTSEKYSAASVLSESCENVIGLSGTPIYNYGDEMWSIMNILEYKCLSDLESFKREWCYYDPDGGRWDKVTVKEPGIFGDFLRTEGLMLRRRKEAVMDELPPKRRIVQNIDVNQGVFDELIAPAVKQALNIPKIKDPWERGKQSMEAIDVARMATGIAKAHFVCAFVKMLMEAGETVLLYAHHHRVIDIFIDELKEYYPVIISGRQNQKIKDESQQEFMKGNTDLIIVSLRSGTGLNLQRARCVVFGELDWSPAAHTQCEDRAHRIGVKDSVLCYYLTCNYGTDQDMMETLGLKTSQFLSIMGDKVETEDDKMLARATMKEHMNKIIKTLQGGGKKKPSPITEVAEKIRNLERMPKRVEPTSLEDFYEGEPGL